jgi:hypothetical protein
MMPNATTRPRGASGPLGSMAFHLAGYSYAVHDQVLMRAVRILQHGGEGGLEKSDRLAMAAKISLSLLAAIPAQMALGEVRSAMFDDKEARKRYKEHAVENAISRSGLLGAVEPWFQLLAGMRYHKDLGTAMAGPGAGRLLSAGQTAVNYAQGAEHTPSESRKLATAVYDAGLSPGVNFAATALPLPIAAAITQIMGSANVKEKFVSHFGGRRPPARHYRD